ncbi:hypothetical protein SASPL_110181 [Salvia splendens]|uniref:HAT C-terminal dimerisation domain-containing protein n=1 Tax=Salvia splendens TaxID=180675 RepID=A0A8X8Y465_SALSN|nr:hypothetical protein SASPL_110181 [Salvia splendens]
MLPTSRDTSAGVGMLPKKHLSGAQKRKKRKQDELFVESQRGALDKFFSVSSNVNVNEDQGQKSGHEQEHDHNLAAEVEVNEDATAPGEQSLIAEVEINEENSNEENLHTENPNGTASGEPSLHTENSDGLLSIFDPSTWENLDNVKRDLLIEKGPVRELNLEFPKDAIGRHFSYAFYSRKLPNNEFITVEDCYPNVSIAYRILLTIPVTVASAERSFSKLKLLKNYLRSTMSQDRLNGLATCSIENGILENVDLNIVLADFASRNARRSFLL